MSQSNGSAWVVTGKGFFHWLFDSGHRQIALRYLVAVTSFFLIGALFALLLKLELIDEEPVLFSASVFGRLFTMHGLFMVFLFLIPAIPSVLGILLVPKMLGAPDLAFPKLNLLGWYLFVTGGLCILLAALRGGFDSTWTLTFPVSDSGGSGNLILAAVGMAFGGLSLLVLSINFIVTVHKLRSPGVSWGSQPVFVWSQYISSVMLILAVPVFVVMLFLIVLEQLTQTGIFDPERGGDPILLRRLFWLYARPALYAVAIPALGLISQVITIKAGKGSRDHRYEVGAFLAIAFLGFLTAGGHFYTESSALGALVSSLMNNLIVLPFGFLLILWLLRLFGGKVDFDTPMLYCLSAIILALSGGLAGLLLASMGANVPLHNTLFVVAHFHYLLAGSIVMAYLGGLHQWWNQISGRDYPDIWSKVGVVVLFGGVNLTFLPILFLGFLGAPRRQAHYSSEFETLNIFSAAGVPILILGYLFPMAILLWSIKRGNSVSNMTTNSEKWNARGLPQ